VDSEPAEITTSGIDDVVEQGAMLSIAPQGRRATILRAVEKMRDGINGEVVKAAEDLMWSTAVGLNQQHILGDFLLDHSSGRALQHQRLGISVGDQFLALAVLLHCVECEEVLLAVDIKHSVEPGPLEAASSTVDRAESVQIVAVHLIRTNADDRPIFEMERMYGSRPRSCIVIQSQAPFCESVKLWAWNFAFRIKT
jgi:hypothetical protein